VILLSTVLVATCSLCGTGSFYGGAAGWGQIDPVESAKVITKFTILPFFIFLNLVTEHRKVVDYIIKSRSEAFCGKLRD
jgi:hypothetical protein